MSGNVVIVESPAKAKTINKYLGKDYKVLASYGHVRDLPSKDGSVDPDHDFTMKWNVDQRAGKRIDQIAEALKGKKKLILATDPDREGEAISWHLLEVLRAKGALAGVDIERVVFNAITRTAVLDALEKPRVLDDELIEAYLARRALDYLVGFTLSPVLWRKLPGSRSAGRVQSVALRLICERELEIEAFKSQEYWTVDADVSGVDGTSFTARLVELDGNKLKKFDLPSEEAARNAVEAIQRTNLSVAAVEQKPTRRQPAPPFITSTMQQEAARKLGFAASRTMQVAQKLYEGVDIGGETTGLITYMRTDGVQMAPEAISEARRVIESEYGSPYVPEKPRYYKSKAKNAQEAHESIRPTSLSRLPAALARKLEPDAARLYELIWKRAIASQMENAQLERTTIELKDANREVGLRATGTVITFDGFLKVYFEGHDDVADEDDGARLPQLAEGDNITTREVKPEQHFTEPPPRYTEASLVKKLEELGIGRPSTYAQILSVLRDRKYVHMDRNRFIPEDKGRLVTAFLENFFSRYVEYDFTAGLEQKLDQVSAGELDWREFLHSFWDEFKASVDEISDLRITQVLDALNEALGPHVFPPRSDGTDPRQCPACGDGLLSLKVGRYGAFVGCSNYPDCKYTRAITASDEETSGAEAGPKLLGKDPETGLEVTLREGRFGAYVQLGEAEEKKKPKRTGVPKTMDPATLDLDRALQLLSLPREVGSHPETGKKITAGLGRFGPYVLHDGTYASVPDIEELFSIGINRAVTLLAEKKTRGRRSTSKPLKDLGEHPSKGGRISIMDGRYGPYVKHGRVNASLPAGSDVDSVSLDEAVELIEKKSAKKKSAKSSRTKKKSTKKKVATKNSAKKKVASKTSATEVEETSD